MKHLTTLLTGGLLLAAVQLAAQTAAAKPVIMKTDGEPSRFTTFANVLRMIFASPKNESSRMYCKS